jgi:hypothetical protein
MPLRTSWAVKQPQNTCRAVDLRLGGDNGRGIVSAERQFQSRSIPLTTKLRPHLTVALRRPLSVGYVGQIE